ASSIGALTVHRTGVPGLLSPYPQGLNQKDPLGDWGPGAVTPVSSKLKLGGPPGGRCY
ncbi:hypothetical protein GWI33_016202, partial [Rhynchophorus ferrugineus]